MSLLPSRISYKSFSIPSKGAQQVVLARRELFDIRAQMMAEDDGTDGRLVAGLSTDDIDPKVYEGGFKTWECSFDLAEYLATHMEEGMLHAGTGHRHIIEVGLTLPPPNVWRNNQNKSLEQERLCLQRYCFLTSSEHQVPFQFSPPASPLQTSTAQFYPLPRCPTYS